MSKESEAPILFGGVKLICLIVFESLKENLFSLMETEQGFVQPYCVYGFEDKQDL